VGEGTGLGLSISYEIAKNHGGDIVVRSRKGEGTAMRVELPAFRPPSPNTSQTVPRVPEGLTHA
jgi:two-component system, NtrC family, sensor kinase